MMARQHRVQRAKRLSIPLAAFSAKSVFSVGWCA